MKLKIEESLEETLERLIKRSEKPSFANNKGLTKIERFIILDSVAFIKLSLPLEEGDSLHFSPNSDEWREQ